MEYDGAGIDRRLPGHVGSTCRTALLERREWAAKNGISKTRRRRRRDSWLQVSEISEERGLEPGRCRSEVGACRGNEGQVARRSGAD